MNLTSSVDVNRNGFLGSGFLFFVTDERLEYILFFSALDQMRTRLSLIVKWLSLLTLNQASGVRIAVRESFFAVILSPTARPFVPERNSHLSGRRSEHPQRCVTSPSTIRGSSSFSSSLTINNAKQCHYILSVCICDAPKQGCLL